MCNFIEVNGCTCHCGPFNRSALTSSSKQHKPASVKMLNKDRFHLLHSCGIRRGSLSVSCQTRSLMKSWHSLYTFMSCLILWRPHSWMKDWYKQTHSFWMSQRPWTYHQEDLHFVIYYFVALLCWNGWTDARHWCSRHTGFLCCAAFVFHPADDINWLVISAQTLTKDRLLNLQHLKII